MDRNSVIGFVLLGALLIGYIFWNQQSANTAKLEKARQDSIANLNKPKEEQAKPAGDSTLALDSTRLTNEYGTFASAATGTEQQQVLENKLVKITFSNKGGEPRTVQLLNFKTSEGKPLFLQQGSFNRTGLKIPLPNNQTLNTSDVYFTPGEVKKEADGSQRISYRLNNGQPGQYLEYTYSLKADSYLVDYTINIVGMQNVLPKGNISLQWNAQADRQEHNKIGRAHV